MSELEDTVKRKRNALTTANHRRQKTEEKSHSETAQAWGATKLARSALEEVVRKSSSLRERAEDAEKRVGGFNLYTTRISLAVVSVTSSSNTSTSTVPSAATTDARGPTTLAVVVTATVLAFWLSVVIAFPLLGG